MQWGRSAISGSVSFQVHREDLRYMYIVIEGKVSPLAYAPTAEQMRASFTSDSARIMRARSAPPSWLTANRRQAE